MIVYNCFFTNAYWLALIMNSILTSFTYSMLFRPRCGLAFPTGLNWPLPSVS